MNSPQKTLQLTSQHVFEDQEKYGNDSRRKIRTNKLLRQIDEHQLMDLKIDYAFKQLFGNERNKDITVVFLNAFLIQAGRDPIQKLYFRNIEIGGEYIDDKKGRLDVLVQTESKEWINVEIQFNNQYNIEKRSLFYWSRIYNWQLEAGQEYDELNPVITINIMNFEMFQETDAFHTMFHLYDIAEKIRLTTMQEYHFVEIPKLIRAWKQDKLNPWDDLLTRWLLLLGVVDKKRNYFYEDIFRELEEIAVGDKSLDVAMRVWEDLSRTQEERLEYEARLKQILDEQSRLRSRERAEQRRKEAEQQKEVAEQQREEAEQQKEVAEQQREEAEQQRKEAVQQKEIAEQNYEQQKVRFAEEKQKRLELEERTALAGHNAVKAVARQFLENGISFEVVIQNTGLTEAEVKTILEDISKDKN
ncbi:Rpn family recombination-promoting nuclease/putative transposase [Oceanobacillus jeddahense]|uniref:Rpn family recombination-promoting nuclease/putative transposase n=1 Tax=Oceanobacillus jeddahense TaxID=1462527 RepID=UPI0006944CB5|nr:Rpn family recombination-promoting nuclease/putative transposase [Oceanobacillus jeddahense]